jgi:pimeloyl-ACP methyl ester carboxylesterase
MKHAQHRCRRMILIGYLWGGTLAAYYAAAHPNRVDKLIFHSPESLWIHKFVPFECCFSQSVSHVSQILWRDFSR